MRRLPFTTVTLALAAIAFGPAANWAYFLLNLGRICVKSL